MIIMESLCGKHTLYLTMGGEEVHTQQAVLGALLLIFSMKLLLFDWKGYWGKT